MAISTDNGLGAPYTSRAAVGTPGGADPLSGLRANPPASAADLAALAASLNDRFDDAGTTPWELPNSKPA